MEISSLATSYPMGASITTSPFNGVYSGSYSSSGFGNGGTNGYYRSSVGPSNTNIVFVLIISSSGNSTTKSVPKSTGFSVRCLFES